jgi:hypothetical protein
MITVCQTRWGWSAFDGPAFDGKLIASANTIDLLLPLMRELEVKSFTVELES